MHADWVVHSMQMMDHSGSKHLSCLQHSAFQLCSPDQRKVAYYDMHVHISHRITSNNSIFVTAGHAHIRGALL